VISAILVTIWLANLYVMRRPVPHLRPGVACLFVSLSVHVALPIEWVLGLPPGAKELLVGLVTSGPCFFAGIGFSTMFAASKAVGAALAAKLLGSMGGGMLEAASFILGIRALLVIGGVLDAGALVMQRAGHGGLARRRHSGRSG
jgi:hypothetical protein